MGERWENVLIAKTIWRQDRLNYTGKTTSECPGIVYFLTDTVPYYLLVLCLRDKVCIGYAGVVDDVNGSVINTVIRKTHPDTISTHAHRPILNYSRIKVFFNSQRRISRDKTTQYIVH